MELETAEGKANAATLTVLYYFAEGMNVNDVPSLKS
jgi:hypothetical protein